MATRSTSRTGRQPLPLVPQDLVYSLDLVDYLDDEIAVKLLDWNLYDAKAGGRAIIGAMHASNPSRAVMDHLLDWRLIHRDETR